MIVASAILKDGKIYTGHRHHNILNDAVPLGSLKNGEQGFVTESGEFLNRKDAAKYALDCGQIKELKFNSKELFSEDLW